MSKGYCLEVLKLSDSTENGLFIHVGYMQIIFKTKETARKYHDTHNTKSRAINILGTDTSDWDPETFLAYTIRDYNPHVVMDIPPFDPSDSPKITIYPGSRHIEYKVL